MRYDKIKTNWCGTILPYFAIAIIIAVATLTKPTVAHAQIANQDAYVLGSAEWDVLWQVRQQCQEITDGQRTSTTFDIDLSGILGASEWQIDDQGLINAGQDGSQSVESFKSYAKSKLMYVLNLALVVLYRDAPGVTWWLWEPNFIDTDIEWTESEQGGRRVLSISRATGGCSVAPSCSTGNEHEVSAQSIREAQEAMAEARSIAARHAGEPAEQRVKSYCDEIYSLTSYAYGAGAATFQSDSKPWSFVSVFDGDPSTRSICEGYSKALSLLVELSGNSDIACHMAKGMCSHSNGRRNHMWCVIRMDDGKNYWVDITNSQPGAIGAGCGIIVPAYGSPEGGYEIPMIGQTIRCEYDDDTLWIYNQDALWISDTPYAAPARATHTEQGTSPSESVAESEKTDALAAEENSVETPVIDKNSTEQPEQKRTWDIPLVDNTERIADVAIERIETKKSTSDGWVIPAAVTLVVSTSVAALVITIIKVRMKNKKQVAAYGTKIQTLGR